MKPYYRDRGITIYHGDCREIFPQLEKESDDLILTDPPYGVSYISERKALDAFWPRPEAKVGYLDGITDVAGLKTILGFMIWASDHL